MKKTKKSIRLHTCIKGNAMVYSLSVLLLITTLCSMLSLRAERYLKTIRQMDSFIIMNQAEILTINHLKQDFRNYKETNELFLYKGCIITVCVDGLRADIEIRYKGYIRSRVLIYDDCEEVVEDYY